MHLKKQILVVMNFSNWFNAFQILDYYYKRQFKRKTSHSVVYTSPKQATIQHILF